MDVGAASERDRLPVQGFRGTPEEIERQWYEQVMGPRRVSGDVRRARPPCAQGLMFWFRWNTLSGSYRCFTSRSRLPFGPNAAATVLLSATSSAFR